jgi:tetratricopeptide (TPR) repeat protein
MQYWLKEEWATALQQDPRQLIQKLEGSQDSDELYCLAVAHEHLKQFHMAERCLKAALQQNLGHIPAIYTMALRAFSKQRELEGKNYLRRALRLDPHAAKTSIEFLRELRQMFAHTVRSTDLGIWLLKELVRLSKATENSHFNLGKLLFEKSHYEDAVQHLLLAIKDPEVSRESTEYLSYIYEHLYRGDELIEKSLELADQVHDRSDLFFNLAMVCQHDQGRPELSLHFFYLASKEDPQDPGLRFSLEQAAAELINQTQRVDSEDRNFLLMVAHLYQGALGVAKRYAQTIRNMKYPHSFEDRHPPRLWRQWLLRDEGVLGQALRAWFGEDAEAEMQALSRLP